MWWIALALIIAGILLMFVEFLLVPGVGVAGIFSLISLGAACWYTFDYIGNNAGWWVTSVVLALLLILLFIILRTKTWKKFELDTDVTSQVNTASSQLHEGDRGVTLTRLAPIGTGRFGTVCCEVKSSDSTMIASGTEVEVVQISDNQVLVKPINIQ